MISEVVMPQMGADMTEGTLLRWLKNEGDGVERGEVIAEIETDKANVEIEAFESGVFRKVLAHEGDVVNVGDVIAVIGAPEDDISRYVERAAPAGAPPAPAAGAPPPPPVAEEIETILTAAAADAAPTAGATPVSAHPPEPPAPAQVRPPQPPAGELRREEPARPTNGRVRASPLARRVAAERGVDLAGVHGSGPGGRILRRDVPSAPAAPQAAALPAPAAAVRPRPAAAPAGTIAGMSRMRQAIARRMSQSKREAPHYYLLVDIDMTDAVALRAQVNDATREDVRVSVNDMIVRACALALQRCPEFNVTLSGEEITHHNVQNVCIAIALDEGLIAPPILDAGSKPLTRIARESKDLADRAKTGTLRPEEMSAGTFTITNLGAYGVETLIGIIQPPQTAILGVGSVMLQPAVRDDEIAVRQIMKVALSADHRLTDGARGAQFLGEIKRLLEKPVSLLL